MESTTATGFTTAGLSAERSARGRFRREVRRQHAAGGLDAGETLETLFRNGPVHACHGVKLRFVNPASGGPPMPTIGAFMQLLPRGFRGGPYRGTDATVYMVVEGRGRTRIGEAAWTWGPRDLFVAPSWTAISHEAEEDAVLFSFSDRPAQQALGFWREQAPLRT
ncbi:MAG: hypothetical protein A3F70_09605 [Acidobacteria bacterium RIFCSPLOWO2_12_FULL_67_14]|nr:MAG: hypothetical protein A3H29_09870 [Acidobacteria bacterium RIFCSPLOWO2_02_FULL_67_21]OFW38283.1 MAG: hypothetical protein A3F70_09605 [Acidobacteria bacterium RIFCSPLOWO2_12_FULL_67_14]